TLMRSIGGIPFDEVDRRVVLPMLDRVEHALLVRQSSVDFIRQRVILPAILRPDDPGAERFRAGHTYSRVVCEELLDSLCLRNGAKDDAALEDCKSIDRIVGDLFP